MNNFDDQLDEHLREQYFGGAPYEQITGRKKHMVFEQEAGIEDIDVELDPEAKQFMSQMKDSSSLRGTKMRISEGLHQAVVKALNTWLDTGSPGGKKGADVLIDAYLSSESAVMLAGDETHTHDLMRGIFALAYATGVKNEALANSEAAAAKRIAAQTGKDPEEVFESRWRFHFELDPSGIKPAPLSREEKAAGIKTKRQGKPLMSAERFRNILQQAQLKLKGKMGGPSVRPSAAKEPYEDPKSDKYVGSEYLKESVDPPVKFKDFFSK